MYTLNPQGLKTERHRVDGSAIFISRRFRNARLLHLSVYVSQDGRGGRSWVHQSRAVTMVQSCPHDKRSRAIIPPKGRLDRLVGFRVGWIGYMVFHQKTIRLSSSGQGGRGKEDTVRD